MKAVRARLNAIAFRIAARLAGLAGIASSTKSGQSFALTEHGLEFRAELGLKPDHRSSSELHERRVLRLAQVLNAVNLPGRRPASDACLQRASRDSDISARAPGRHFPTAQPLQGHTAGNHRKDKV